MRVTIVSRIFTPEPSAASFMLASVAERLADAGHEVIVLTTRPPAGMTPDDDARIDVRRSRVLRDRSGYVRGSLPYMSFDIPLAFRLIFTRRSAIYLVEPPPTTGAVARVVLSMLRRPYVYDAADVWADAASLATNSRVVLGLLRRIELFAMRGADHAVTISTEVVERMRELSVSTPATVVGFGADISVFRFVDADTSTHPYFIYAGTFSEWQGAEVFVEAFATFSRDHPSFRLIFIGNGSDRDRLESEASRLRLKNVEFRTAVRGIDLAPLLAGATASLASLKPGVGYDYAFASKIYSSLAMGCPVIFTGPGPTVDFLANAERSQRSGVAVAYEAVAVTDALAMMAGDPLGIRERQALSEWTARNHSLQTAADRIVATIDHVASERTSL
jgi:glycosyltransferase involved in cell wall biosynthesis